MTKLSERELLERAAEVAGINLMFKNELGVDCAFIVWDDPFPIRWNPIASKSDRYELLEAMGADIDFDAGTVGAPLLPRKDYNGREVRYFWFPPGDDARQAQAVLEAANAVWESRHA